LWATSSSFMIITRWSVLGNVALVMWTWQLGNVDMTDWENQLGKLAKYQNISVDFVIWNGFKKQVKWTWQNRWANNIP
jgi:hypothetical protein